jgi:hypothetical protein
MVFTRHLAVSLFVPQLSLIRGQSAQESYAAWRDFSRNLALSYRNSHALMGHVQADHLPQCVRLLVGSMGINGALILESTHEGS